jgi:hypothetical protein
VPVFQAFPDFEFRLNRFDAFQDSTTSSNFPLEPPTKTGEFLLVLGLGIYAEPFESGFCARGALRGVRLSPNHHSLKRRRDARHCGMSLRLAAMPEADFHRNTFVLARSIYS